MMIVLRRMKKTIQTGNFRGTVGKLDPLSCPHSQMNPCPSHVMAVWLPPGNKSEPSLCLSWWTRVRIANVSISTGASASRPGKAEVDPSCRHPSSGLCRNPRDWTGTGHECAHRGATRRMRNGLPLWKLSIRQVLTGPKYPFSDGRGLSKRLLQMSALPWSFVFLVLLSYTRCFHFAGLVLQKWPEKFYLLHPA